MTKFFNSKGQNINGIWNPKKRRLPRKFKKWVKRLDNIRNKKYNSKYLTRISMYSYLLEYRAHRNYIIGKFYYKQVLKIRKKNA